MSNKIYKSFGFLIKQINIRFELYNWTGFLVKRIKYIFGVIYYFWQKKYYPVYFLCKILLNRNLHNSLKQMLYTCTYTSISFRMEILVNDL